MSDVNETEMQHANVMHTVLIGSSRRAEELRIEKRISHTDFASYFTVVETRKALRTAMRREGPTQVLFLRGWLDLEYGRRMYDACLSHGWAQPWNRGPA